MFFFTSLNNMFLCDAPFNKLSTKKKSSVTHGAQNAWFPPLHNISMLDTKLKKLWLKSLPSALNIAGTFTVYDKIRFKLEGFIAW